MKFDTNDILNDLKSGKDARTQHSLDKLNDILEEYCRSGQKDFSVTNIGRVSSNNGGPGYQSLRSTRNTHYRRLIEAWALKAGTGMKKPLAEFSRQRDIPADNKLLERLDDPALRAIFGQIIAEKNRLKNEVNLLKQNANVVIDRRPARTSPANVELLHSLTGLLNSMEVTALQYAISDDCMAKQGWHYTKAGQVKELENNDGVYPRGYINAIRKVLGIVE